MINTQPPQATLAELIAEFQQVASQPVSNQRWRHLMSLTSQTEQHYASQGVRALATVTGYDLSTLQDYLHIHHDLDPALLQQYQGWAFSMFRLALMAAKRYANQPPKNTAAWWLAEAERRHWNPSEFQRQTSAAVQNSTTGQAPVPSAPHPTLNIMAWLGLEPETASETLVTPPLVSDKDIALFKEARQHPKQPGRWEQIVIAARVARDKGMPGLEALSKAGGISLSLLRDYTRMHEAITPKMIQKYSQFPFSMFRLAVAGAQRNIENPRNTVEWWLAEACRRHWSTTQMQDAVYHPASVANVPAAPASGSASPTESAPTSEPIRHNFPEDPRLARIVRQAERQLKQADNEMAGIMQDVEKFNVTYAEVTGERLEIIHHPLS